MSILVTFASCYIALLICSHANAFFSFIYCYTMRSFTICSAGSTLPNNHLPDPSGHLRLFNIPARPLPPEQPVRISPCTSQTCLPLQAIDQSSFFNIHTDTPLLSAQAKSYVTRVIQSSLAKSTLKRYSGAIRQFIHFCDSQQVPAHLRFPADELLLCTFAASSLGRHARSTTRSRLSALRTWHMAHNMEWKGSSRLCCILNGIHNQAPGNSSPPPCPPTNAHLGELLPASSSLLFPVPLPTYSHFKRSLQNPKSCLLHLLRTKTHYNGQDVVWLINVSPSILSSF